MSLVERFNSPWAAQTFALSSPCAHVGRRQAVRSQREGNGRAAGERFLPDLVGAKN